MSNLTILVSPHPDDIALSIGGMIVGNMLPKPLLDVTLFTRSYHAPYGYRGISPFIERMLPSGFRMGRRFRKSLTLLEINRYRKREDLRFFKSQGIHNSDLDLLDAQLRGHRNPMNVSHHTRSDHLVFETIRSQIMKLTSRLDGGYILVPLGLGGHIDHQIAKDACLAVRGNLCPVFYEDLPYAADVSLEDIDKMVNSLDSTLQPVVFEIGSYLQTKISNIRLYSTQIGKKELDRTARHAARLCGNNKSCERLWFPGNQIKDVALRFNRSDAVEKHNIESLNRVLAMK